jgi:hypothetical protein
MYDQKIEATLRGISHAAKLDKGSMIKNSTLTFEFYFDDNVASGWGELGTKVLEQIRDSGLASAGLANDSLMLIQIWPLCDEPEDAIMLSGTGTGKARVTSSENEEFDPTIMVAVKVPTHPEVIAKLLEHHMTTVNVKFSLAQTSMF